jgi:hypothetical protein
VEVFQTKENTEFPGTENLKDVVPAFEMAPLTAMTALEPSASVQSSATQGALGEVLVDPVMLLTLGSGHTV